MVVATVNRLCSELLLFGLAHVYLINVTESFIQYVKEEPDTFRPCLLKSISNQLFQRES